MSESLLAAITTEAAPVSVSSLEYVSIPNLITGTGDIIINIPPKSVSVSGSTDYYLNTYFKYASGQPQHYGKLEAIRIR